MPGVREISPSDVEKMMGASDARLEELKNYQKCVKGNLSRLLALTDIRIGCGSRFDPHLCDVIPKEVLMCIMNDAVQLLVTGIEFNGKMNDWKNGCFGSRWFDMDASKYGLDYIRAAFYSKKHNSGEWRSEEPYAIRITAEKAKVFRNKNR
jgi:hypothetical protein